MYKLIVKECVSRGRAPALPATRQRIEGGSRRPSQDVAGDIAVGVENVGGANVRASRLNIPIL
jgi:hypothetical protein